MSDEQPFPMIGEMTSEQSLAVLRQHLKLTEKLPRITKTHPIAGALDLEDPNGVHAVICCHDDANGGVHQVLYPLGLIDERDPNAHRLVRWHLSRVIAAPHN